MTECDKMTSMCFVRSPLDPVAVGPNSGSRRVTSGLGFIGFIGFRVEFRVKASGSGFRVHGVHRV